MARRLTLVLSVFGLALLGQPAVSQGPPSFRTLDGVDSFVKTYYRSPRPDLIADLFRALQPTGVSQQPNAVPPFVGFLSEVFAANPGREAEWQALVPKQEGSTRQLLYRALAISKAGGVLMIEGHSPALNDMYWGAFFASGRTAFLQKLVDQLRYCDERDDEVLFFAGATAKWSLASNAQSDPLVRSTLAGQTLKVDQRTRALITELLTQPPAQVKQEIADIVRDQRAAGKWRTVTPTLSVPTDKPGGDSLWVSKHKSEIDTLQLLSQERASRQPDTTSDPRRIAARGAAQLGQARTYGSLARILDRSKNELATHDYVVVMWQIEHADPDRYHVVQTAWDGSAYVYDEWITLEDSEFAFVGRWLELGRAAGTTRRELGRKLGLQKYIQVLQSQPPTSIGTYSYAGRHYSLLSYSLSVSGDFEAFLTDSSGSIQLALWIDSASGLLVKAHVVPAASPSGGVPAEFEQVFVSYSGDIRVDAPRVEQRMKK